MVIFQYIITMTQGNDIVQQQKTNKTCIKATKNNPLQISQSHLTQWNAYCIRVISSLNYIRCLSYLYTPLYIYMINAFIRYFTISEYMLSALFSHEVLK